MPQGATDQRADNRHPGVTPVRAALALDRQDGVGDARPEVTSRVDRVPGRPTERGTDADDQQRDEQRPEALRGAAEIRMTKTSTKVPMTSVTVFQA